MSEKAHSTILLVFGLIGVLGTIGAQVLGVGEIKGTVMAMLRAHDQRFEAHDKRLDQQDTKLTAAELQIERIKGRVGIAAVRPAANSATASLPPCTETEPEQTTR